MSKKNKGPKEEVQLPKYSVAALDAGQLNMMYQFLQMGSIKSNPADVRVLKEHLDMVRQALIQMTAGQRKGDPSYYVDFNELGTITNIIVCAAMSLYLSGDLDRLQELMEAGHTDKPDEGERNESKTET